MVNNQKITKGGHEEGKKNMTEENFNKLDKNHKLKLNR